MNDSNPQTNSEHNETSSSSENHKCKVCFEQFDSLQEVLKHELLRHAGNKNSKKLPVNRLKRSVNAVLKTINGPDEKKFRREIAEAISDCAEGTELNVIFKRYKMDNENLLCVYSRILTCLEGELKKIGMYFIHGFGSIANGLALKSSDIDLHISSQEPLVNPATTYKHITKMLFRSSCFSDVIPIRKARVPIIKCVHKKTGFSLDINTSEPYGVHNSKFIHDLNQLDPRIHNLLLFLRIWSKNMHIYGAFHMTNYCLISLVIFYLQKCEPPVLGSIKLLQKNGTKRVVNGINFGINPRMLPLDDSSQDIDQLIKGFFDFYQTFDFDKFIIAPYLAKAILRSDFRSNVFNYPEYVAQLQMLTLDGGDIESLNIDRPMCVQDMFCLNINVAKGLSEANVQYFKKCVKLAHQKCIKPGISKKNLYKALLVDIIEDITEMIPTNEPERPNSSSGNLVFDIIPRRSELKALSKFCTNQKNVQKLWVKEYTDAIVQVITEVYRIDMTLLSPTCNNKYKKIDEMEEGATPLPSRWSISCYVDLWSGRQMQRGNMISFMEYQLAQTEELHAKRRQDSNFAVQFKGYLTISIIQNYSALHVEATSTAPLNKKDPLRRFFNTLKNSMQNYNLKHRIHQLEGNAKQ